MYLSRVHKYQIIFLTHNEVWYEKASVSQSFNFLLSNNFLILAYFCQVECFGTMLPTQQYKQKAFFC